MNAALQFKPVGPSVFPSQLFEVISQKQSALSDVGQTIRGVLSQLDPEITASLLSEYKDPDNSLIQKMEAGLIERELLISIDENTLDTGYFNSKASLRMDDLGIGPDDDWNSPSPT